MKAESARYAESRVRVRYQETDQMGIAHHANYLVWFEIGRTDLCREAGLSYRDIEQQGYLLVVAEIGCRYRSPFRYDDEVHIRTRVGSVGSRAIRFEYELVSSTGATMATGHSSHIWLAREEGRAVAAPRDLVDRFRRFL